MKATKQYFPVVLFIMLYKMVLTFEFVDEILKCDHSSEKLLSSTFLWCLCSNFWVCGWNSKMWPFKWNTKLLIYQLSWYGKSVTVKKMKADVSSVSPSSERIQGKIFVRALHDSLWRRDNSYTRNVSLQFIYGGQFTLPTQLLNPNFVFHFPISATPQFLYKTNILVHSNESCWELLSYGSVYTLHKMVSPFESVNEILKSDHSNQPLSSFFL